MAIQIPDTNVPNTAGSGGSAANPAGHSGEIAELRGRLPGLKDAKTKLEAAMRECGGSTPPKLSRDHRKVCDAIAAIEKSAAQLEKFDREAVRKDREQHQRADRYEPEKAEKGEAGLYQVLREEDGQVRVVFGSKRREKTLLFSAEKT